MLAQNKTMCTALNVPYVTAYRALFTKGQAEAGDTVLVHGARYPSSP